ncbi:uncharacterized protein LOC117259687 isoform X2 [Epinephelus lanceolatus]|uniref:EF-hand domain-containing protein D1 isoform X2 n=1 Tax=Epinephelus lanceolatus TaxID=310571 RepID=UPI001446CE37|nr:EF-hand domain-containing protein D1 isoform X2 [Epinephelus lanceolatus]
MASEELARKLQSRLVATWEDEPRPEPVQSLAQPNPQEAEAACGESSSELSAKLIRRQDINEGNAAPRLTRIFNPYTEFKEFSRKQIKDMEMMFKRDEDGRREMKMDASFVLFKAPRRVTFREEDMTVEKMAKILQVTSQSLYLAGDNNVAVFPRVDGRFSSLSLRDKAHYEVHGAKAAPDASGNVAALGPPPTPSSNSQFCFSRSASSASPSLPPRAQSLKYFTRTVRLGELHSGKLVNSRMVVIRFTEQEASVPSMIAKTKYALGSNKPLILTDHNGVEILDSEGTRGSFYWKQNSRKIMAVPEADFQAVEQKRRRIS